MSLRFRLIAIMLCLLMNPAYALAKDETKFDETANQKKVLAQNSSTEPTTTTTPGSKNEKVTADSKPASLVDKLKAAPIQAASFITGIAVGSPIAVVRIGLHDAADSAAAIPIIGSSDNPALVWGSRALVYPICAFSGVLQAPFYSLHNSWKNAGSAPFSKDALGFGKLDDDWL